ncbi:hypothetical protein BV22DRAFT_995247, partial [Leucogyrophana mollusca]
LRVWQQNLRKSQAAQEDFLKDLSPDLYDVAAIQEPHLNFVNLAPVPASHWTTVYPTCHNVNNADRTQSLILVSKRLSKNNWHIIPLDNPNVTAIEIKGGAGRTRIYNIYNACDHSRTL